VGFDNRERGAGRVERAASYRGQKGPHPLSASVRYNILNSARGHPHNLESTEPGSLFGLNAHACVTMDDVKANNDREKRGNGRANIALLISLGTLVVSLASGGAAWLSAYNAYQQAEVAKKTLARAEENLSLSVMIDLSSPLTLDPPRQFADISPPRYSAPCMTSRWKVLLSNTSQTLARRRPGEADHPDLEKIFARECELSHTSRPYIGESCGNMLKGGNYEAKETEPNCPSRYARSTPNCSDG
jgi:hypothetical protein